MLQVPATFASPLPWRLQRAIERALLNRPTGTRANETLLTGDEAPLIRLVALGDVALTRAAEIDANAAFGALRDVIETADVRTANLEAPLTSHIEPEGVIGSFVRADPQTVSVLQEARLDVLNVANNHALDFGPAALEDTVHLLRNAGLNACGILAADGPPRPATVLVNGRRIGFLGFCDDHFPVHPDPPGPRPAQAVPVVIEAAVSAARAELDVLVVHLHWGYEFALHPLLRHRDLARRIVELGTDLVLCHHAHVPMAVELWHEGVIAHGLGNGLTRMSPYMREGHPWTDRSFLLDVCFSERGVCRVSIHPFRIRPDWRVEYADDLTCRRLIAGLSRLAQRLDGSDRLRRLEEGRLAGESIRLLSALTDAAGKDSAALQQRAAGLRLPRQRELLAELARQPDTTSLAERLSELAEVAFDGPAAVDRAFRGAARSFHSGLEALRTRCRWVDALRARVP
jgi:poly-gamma-glutamate synthesis protein (capsule biosynthesis protein)